MMIETACDVAVLGAGPAGSAAAAWLAGQGRKVVVLEREAFPRFKIGESLLPNGNRLLREIGVWDDIVRGGFVRKVAAEFTDPTRERRYRNVFAEGLLPGLEGTYQVERATFDTVLRDHAIRRGASVWQPHRVDTVRAQNGGWRLETRSPEGEARALTARWVIDATGRDAFLGRALHLPRVPFPYPSRFAVFTHFEGAPRAEGDAGGDIIITRLRHGWFWWIPLAHGKTSVGVVAGADDKPARDEELEAYLYRRIEQTPWLRDALDGRRACEPVRSVADYSYTHRDYAGPNWLLAGDAAGFVDPIFSSGVYLALESGLLAARTVDAQLTAGRDLTAAGERRYTRSLQGRMRVMRRLIEAFYDDRGWAVFMSAHRAPRMAAAVNAVVAGQTQPPWAVRWRYAAFLLLCRLNRRFHFLDLDQVGPAEEWRSRPCPHHDRPR